MTDHQYKVGDEVWTTHEVLEVAKHLDRKYPVRLGRGTEWPENILLKTAADFKDPLDEAIVEAAIELRKQGIHAGRGSVAATVKLWDAVEAKLDAARPRLQVGDRVRIYASGPDDDDDTGSDEWRDCVVDIGVIEVVQHESFGTKIRARTGGSAWYPSYFRIERIENKS